ncbi:MAG: DNA polymerase III subunit chi [Comamonadaceae bacterium]|nr:DNA polymerase III subunit chi [Comamonadaceae bacterium]
MPEIAFHFNAPDKLAYACRFLRKALRHGCQVLVVAPPALLPVLDEQLWHMQPQDFVAHAVEGCEAELWRLSPIALASSTDGAPHQDVLLNLGAGIPAGFERFARVVEVVSAHDMSDRQLARQRWRDYQAGGHALIRHDLVQQGS